MAIFSEQIKLLISADTKGVSQPMSKMAADAKKAETSFDKLARSVGLSGETLKKGLVAGAAALVGPQLISGVKSLADGYAEATQAAYLLSQATNSSMEDASRFNAVASRFGLDMNDIVEIFSDFQQAVGMYQGELKALGVDLAVAANGTTDWVATSVAFLEAVNKVGDATERNRLLFKFFGEEGAKQLMAMVNSGVSLEEALAAVDTAAIFDTKDLQTVREYNKAMTGLGKAANSLQLELGRGLVPALTDLANLAVPLVRALTAVPPEMYLMVGAAIALNRVISAQLVASAIPAATRGMYILAASLVSPKLGFDLLAIGAARAGAAMKAAFLTNPIGWLVTAIGLAVVANEKFKDSLAETGQEVDRLVESGVAFEEAMATALGLTREAAEKVKNDPMLGPVYEAQADAARKAAEERKKLAQEQGAYAAVTQKDTDAQKALKDMLSSGVYSQEQLSSAVANAANAQRDQNRVTEQGKSLMEAYAASSWDAVNATLAQIDKNYAQNRAVREYHKQVKETEKILKSGKATQEEKNQALDDLGISALNAANALVELKTQEALLAGTTLSAKEKNDILIASLKERKREASTKAERDEIDALIRKVETAQTTAGETYIEFAGVKWKEGTTEEEVNKLKREWQLATKTGDFGVAAEIQKEIDSLKFTEKPLPVVMVGSDGKTPLTGEQAVNITVTTPGAVEAQTQLTNLVNPTAPYEAKINVKVYGWIAAEAILNNLAKDRFVTIWTTTQATGAGLPDTVPGAGAGRSLAYALSDSGVTRYAAGENGQAYKVRNGSIEPASPPQGTQVIVNLDGRVIASYLEPAVGRKRSA